MLCCPHPTKIWKLGRSVGIFFFFFFTYRERVEFSNMFLKVSKWGKLGRNAVKTHIFILYKSCKCFFKPLNTNFSKFFAQIWHKKKKKKTRPCFFAFYGRSGEGNITKKKLGPYIEFPLYMYFNNDIYCIVYMYRSVNVYIHVRVYILILIGILWMRNCVFWLNISHEYIWLKWH